MRPALAIIFGGGIKGGRTVGMETYLHLVGDFVRNYLAVCDWLGVPRGGDAASAAEEISRVLSMAVFPSLDWFRKVRDVYNSDGSLHKGGGGACHTTAAFKVNGQSYLIVSKG